MAIKTPFSETKFFVAVLVSFIVIQIGSYVLSELGFMPFIKLGWGLILILFGVIITTLFVLGRKLGELSLKKEGPFVGLIFLTIILMFVFLPSIIPEIFSTYSIQISESIRETVGSIISATGSGIGN